VFAHQTSDPRLELAVLSGVDERVDAAVHEAQYGDDVVVPARYVGDVADHHQRVIDAMRRPAHDESEQTEFIAEIKYKVNRRYRQTMNPQQIISDVTTTSSVTSPARCDLLRLRLSWMLQYSPESASTKLLGLHKFF